MGTLSLCMIVKDEEANISRCLESISSFVDEIIIFDTGSSDQTKAICEKFGAKIFDYEWNNDFSQARNACIKEASSDWILWLDADEQLVLKNEFDLRNALSDNKDCIYTVKMYHVYGSGGLEDKEYHTSHSIRLFPNGKGLTFEGIIHETIPFEESDYSVKLLPSVYLIHYGYQSITLLTKAVRNLNLLVLQKNTSEDNPWIDYHIAAELFVLGHMEKAFMFVNQCISGFLVKGAMPPALIYKLKYEILIYTNSIETAYSGIEKAIKLYPDYVELHFYKGVLLFKQEQYLDAIKAFEYCIILGEEHDNYLIMAGNGSFLASEYIGDCYMKLNCLQNAYDSYQQSLLSHPSFVRVKEKLTKLKDQSSN